MANQDSNLDENEFLKKHIKDPVYYLFSHKVTFDFSKAPLFWRDNSPVKSVFDNAMSIILPRFEYFMIQACQDAKKELNALEDKVLIEQIDAFCEQEDRHAKAHEKFNEHLKSQGFDVERYVGIMDRMLDNYSKNASLKDRLLLGTLFECMTSVLGKFFFITSRDETIDPSLYKLFAWHCLEELEHRCVAFNVYRSFVPKYNPPFFKTFILAAKALFIALWITTHSLYKKKVLFRKSLFKDLIWLFGLRKGPLMALLIGYLRFLNKKYDPQLLFNEEDIQKIVSDWEREYHKDLTS